MSIGEGTPLTLQGSNPPAPTTPARAACCRSPAPAATALRHASRNAPSPGSQKLPSRRPLTPCTTVGQIPYMKVERARRNEARRARTPAENLERKAYAERCRCCGCWDSITKAASG